MNLIETLQLLKKINENIKEPIMVEDLFLLMCIYSRNEYQTEKNLHQDIKWYYSCFQMYDPIGDNPILIKWTERIDFLIKIDLLQAPYGKWWEINKNGYKSIDILKLEVTDKFTKQCLISNKDAVWDYFVEEYGGEYFYVNNTPYPNRLPSKDMWVMGIKTEEDLKSLFWKLAHNGTQVGIKDVFDTMYQYKEVDSLQRGLARFLLEFNTIKKIINKK